MRDTDVNRSRWRGRRAGWAARAMAGCAAAAALAGLTGCVARAGAAPAIQLATAYVALPQTPGSTVAYVVVRNNGPADRLVGARTSVGGRVSFQAAMGRNAAATRTLRAVQVPGHGLLHMVPDGVHMVITGAGPLHGGKDITLTLVFAHAGAVSVIAQVTNPQSGGSSYFLN